MKRLLIAVLTVSCCTFQATVAQEKTFKLTEAEQKLVDLTNAERKKEKLPPYKPSPVLFEVARAHAANMAKQRQMEHDLDGKTPYDRIKGAGYKYSFGGENIARGGNVLDEVIEGWMKSPGHRDNILDKDYTEIGIGVATDDMGNTYYAQVFAKPRK